MDPLFLGLIAVSLFGIGLIFVVLSVRLFTEKDFSERLRDYVEDRGARYTKGSVLQTRELQGPLTERVVTPLVKKLGTLLGRFTPREAIRETNRKLLVAGNPLSLTAREFYGIRLFVLLLSIIPVWYMLTQGVAGIRLVAVFSLPILGYLLPVTWLRSAVSKMQAAVQKALPDTLDMLSVLASAGLGFDQSMQRISEYYDNPLGHEFGRVISEMEMGLSRSEALRNMAERIEVPELSSFVSILIQSEGLGTSIAETLKSQSEQIRILRRYRAQEKAQRLPAKMLFPLAFLILPALLAVILGPSLAAIADLFDLF